MKNSDNDQVINCYFAAISSVEEMTKTRSRFGEIVLRNYFSKCVQEKRNPWQALEKISLSFVLKLRLEQLKEMWLFLLLHLYITCKVKMCSNSQQRKSFLNEIIDWLPNVKSDEENKVHILLLWTQLVGNATQVYAESGDSGNLEKILK